MIKKHALSLSIGLLLLLMGLMTAESFAAASEPLLSDASAGTAPLYERALADRPVTREVIEADTADGEDVAVSPNDDPAGEGDELVCIAWPDLRERLVELGKPLLSFDLCDCPDDIQDLTPVRVMAQYIENTFYLWEEYEIAVGPDACVCIVMRKPQSGPLTAEEAQVLLTASTLWQGVTSPADGESALLEQPRVRQPNAVIGSDDRTRVTNTQTYPWNTHCFLRFKFPLDLSTYRGTGCLVGPYMVLTCGHNIYDWETDRYISSMTVIPGQDQDYRGATVQTPYGTQAMAESRVAPGYTTVGALWADDYGAVFLSRPFSGINTYLPLEFTSLLVSNESIYIAGYPGEVKLGSLSADDNTYALWQASSPLSRTYANYLCYTADTSDGDSGAPIRRGIPLYGDLVPFENAIIGVHTSYDPEDGLNGGPRLCSDNEALITEWMEWTPESAGSIFADTFPSTSISTSRWKTVNNATVDSKGSNEPSSPYALRLNGHPSGGDSVVSRVIDLSSHSQVTLTYWYQQTGGGESPDDGDDLIIEYYRPTHTWGELDKRLGSSSDMTSFQKRTVDLPSSALHENFRLRVRSIGSADMLEVYDDWFVDNITLTAGQGTDTSGPSDSSLMLLPDFVETYQSNETRGFWFRAPTSFRITGLRVPDEAGRGKQNIEVVRFNYQASPPYYGNTTNSFVSLLRVVGRSSGDIVTTNISVSAGDVIGVLGATGTGTMYNSYGEGDFVSSIHGHSVTLRKLAMAHNLYSGSARDLYAVRNTARVGRVEMWYRTE